MAELIGQARGSQKTGLVGPIKEPARPPRKTSGRCTNCDCRRIANERTRSYRETRHDPEDDRYRCTGMVVQRIQDLETVEDAPFETAGQPCPDPTGKTESTSEN